MKKKIKKYCRGFLFFSVFNLVVVGCFLFCWALLILSATSYFGGRLLISWGVYFCLWWFRILCDVFHNFLGVPIQLGVFSYTIMNSNIKLCRAHLHIFPVKDS